MDIETLRAICKQLPSVTEGIKWGNDICFMVCEKMFCVAALDTPLKVSFKVTEEEFDEMSTIEGIIPAPYVARHKCVLVENVSVLNKKNCEHYITQSYNLVRSKLPKKKLMLLK